MELLYGGLCISSSTEEFRGQEGLPLAFTCTTELCLALFGSTLPPAVSFAIRMNMALRVAHCAPFCMLLTGSSVLKCVSHGCSNAVVWGLKTACPSVDRESMHVSIASLLNGSTALHSHTTSLLTRHLQVSAVRSGVFDDIYTF